MKFCTSVILAAVAASVAALPTGNNDNVVERQLLTPEIFALKFLSASADWNGKYIKLSQLGGSTLSVSSAAPTSDSTFMLIGTNLFHGSDAIIQGTPSATSPVSAAAIPTFFNGVPEGKTPLYFTPVDEIPATGDIVSQVQGYDVAPGFAFTAQGHLTHDGSEDWIACDGRLSGGEWGRISGLYIAKGDVVTTGCVPVQVIKA